jgi:hypothetical protein
MFYRRNLNSLKTNIRFIDGVASVEDLESYIEIYQPAAVFLDGSHLLAKTYDWQEVANLTARLKKLTRLKKVPIVNTTHIKSERGKDGKGASIDDLAYSKGYTRDSDIVGVMFASDLMKDAGQFGIDWVKIRRGKSGTKQFFEMDFEKMTLNQIVGLGVTQLMQVCATGDDDGSMWS